MKFEPITFPPKTADDAFCTFYGYTFTTTVRNQRRKLIIFYHQNTWMLLDAANSHGYGAICGLSEKIEPSELEAAALNLVKEINQSHNNFKSR